MGTDYVTITDNADPQMHVNVYRREKTVSENRLVCSVPVFQPVITSYSIHYTKLYEYAMPTWV